MPTNQATVVPVVITVKNTQKTLDYLGNLVAYSFLINFASADGGGYEWPYSLTPSELSTALTGQNLQTIIEREAVKGATEAYKVFPNPPYSTANVTSVDGVIESSTLTVVNGLATLNKK